MERLFPAVCFLSWLISAQSFAGSATWNAAPVDSNWHNPANWTPETVPNGPTDVATFATSNVTRITFSANTEIRQIIFANGASAYSFAVHALTVDGPGLTNLSSQIQQFVVNFTMTFKGNSSAGSGTIITGNGFGVIITFTDTATADRAIISVPFGAGIYFSGQSNAGSANITVENSGYVFLGDDAYAGASASITCGIGGHVEVFGTNDVPVDVGPGYIEVGGGISRQPSVGSLIGAGLAIIDRGSTFTVGNNNLSTEFAGDIINDLNTGRCGGLSKVGTGTLTLSSSTQEYCLGTTVNSGVLLVKNTSGSGTGSGPVTVAGGTLGGRGIISGKVNVGTGTGTGAVIAPSQGASNPTIITLQKLLTFKADGSYLYRLNTNKATADQVIAQGVKIETGAQFNFKVVANKKLTAGTVFTAISNTAATLISGTFANLADGSTVTVGVNKLQVSYSGGDGNDLTLTVVP